MINQDRIVPVQATDLLSLYGTVLYLEKSGALDKISAADVEGDFAVSAASQALIADQPVKSLDIASSVASAEIYFVADHAYEGFKVAGAAASIASGSASVAADGRTLYKAVLSSAEIAFTKIGF